MGDDDSQHVRDTPRFVTDEPGLDPVSGRPWGEETAAKRRAGAWLLILVGAGFAAYMLVASPSADSARTVAAYGAGPLAMVLGLVRLLAERSSDA